jgi:hypothetical protein
MLVYQTMVIGYSLKTEFNWMSGVVIEVFPHEGG